MKIKSTLIQLAALLLLSNLSPQLTTLHAQGSSIGSFTYQGRLKDTNGPANGLYDFTFSLYDNSSFGNQISTSVTRQFLPVTNGLFAVPLDFPGANNFPGTDRWLEIAVHPSGIGTNITLSPRQQITAAPYAIRAASANSATMAEVITGSVSAGQIVGTLPLAQLPVSVVTNGASGVNISGTFTGNGAGITNVDVRKLQQPVHPVVAWGNNSYFGMTTIPAGLNDVVAIAAGATHSLALNGDGTIAAWGNNDYGQTTIPFGLSNVVAIAGGYYHSLVLKSDGTVTAWGYNGSGQTNIPAGLSNVVAIAGSHWHCLALTSNGTVAGWGGSSGESSVPVGLSNVMAIAAGGIHSLVLKSNGMLAAWGSDFYGQTTIPGNLSNVVAIAAGEQHSLALKSDGTVVAWGYNSSGQTNIPAGLSNVMAIAAGDNHSLALKNDGTVVAWGYNGFGQTNIPAGLSNVVAIAGGRFHSLALQGIIPAKVALLACGNVFSGNQSISGNLGIGTATPQQPLHLIVAEGQGEGMRIDSAVAGHSPAIYLNHTGTGGRNFRLASYGDNVNPGSFIIRDDTAGADRLAIDANGTVTATAFSGDGSGLTNLNAASLSGSVPGAALTSVPAANLTGSILDARLPANVALRAGGNDFSGNQSISGNLSFGSTSRQMLNLWGTQYGIGVQADTLYSRCDASSANGGFIWYKGGVHNDAYVNAGGGTELMHLVQGALYVNGALVPSSDRNAKENFAPVQPREVLEKVAALPLSSWNYKADTATRHVGPMAQDFYAAFNVGPDDKHIATVDADGVALAAIQGLNEKVESGKQKAETQIEKLEAENAELKQRLDKLETLMSNINDKHSGGER
jgi:alpha-tubulin suppressor-like RCC1 family protein